MHHRTTSRTNRAKTILTVTAATVLVIVCTTLVIVLTDGHTQRSASAASTVRAAVPRTSEPAPLSALGASPAESPPANAAPVPTPTVIAPITYLVKPGDNLTIIAAWFHMHGYGALYDANEAVIGSNPSLIHPGQVITITSHGMTVG